MNIYQLQAILFVGIFTVASVEAQGDYLKCSADEQLMDPPECPDHEDGLPVYFPYPYDCTKYFECSNGDARCFQCAPGTVWDQELLVCNHEAWSPCKIDTTTIRTTTSTPTPTSRPGSNYRNIQRSRLVNDVKLR